MKYWDAVLLAQEQMDRAKADMKLVEEKIEVKEQERREAARAKEPPELIAAIDKEIDRLVQKERELRKELASTAGEVLAAPQ